jgi:CheY-like chemotaxis protein
MGQRVALNLLAFLPKGVLQTMSKRILVAEDDNSSLMLLKRMIDVESGFEVVTAGDGEAAWTLLMGGTSFDACILDVMMPLLDGLGLTKRIRSHPDLKGLPVILCTAQSDRSTVGQAAALSISAYIIKPYARDRVLKQLKAIGDGRAASASIEPFEHAAHRLGISGSQLTDALKGVVKETAAVAGALRDEAAETGAGPTPLEQISAVKNAASNFGAFSLARALAALEDTIRSGALPNGELFRDLAAESKRLVMALAAKRPGARPVAR